MTLPAELAASPALFPLAVRPIGEVRLLRLSEADYAAASFLDERLLPGRPQELAAHWDDLAAAASLIQAECDFIFHISHVGSTLLARLLGALPDLFPVREPALLRGLARGQLSAAAMPVIARLLARSWRPSQRTVVKATSFVSEIGPDLMAQQPSARAVLMLVGAPTFLATILGGSATGPELPYTIPARLDRLARRLKADPPRVEGPGEMAAAAWLCETWSLCAIARECAGRVGWLDFDAFLLDPRQGLTGVLRTLRGQATQPEVTAMLASPYASRYSKAPEYAFSPGVRRGVLREAHASHAGEISRGLAWLDAVAGRGGEAAGVIAKVGKIVA